MKAFLLVGAGGFIGSYLRYLIASRIEQRLLSSSFPYGIFTVNIVGCFLIGLILGWATRGNLAPEYRLLLATGFCGGFTTFSTFSYQGFILLQNGQLLHSFLYTGLSVIVGFLAVWLGLFLVATLSS